MPITFEIEYLRSLKEDSKSCVYMEHAKEHLALHPFQLDNISNSIKELLNKNIARYCSHLSGILLGYDNIKLLEPDGVICDDSCFVHTDIEADFYVLKPEIDSTLQGVITKISKDHVACLVHKTFTISLPKPENAISWIGNKSQIGQEVQFTIVEAVFEGSLPYIRGNIISLDNIDDSGFSTNEDQLGNEENQLEVPKEKKIRKRKLTESLENQELLLDSPKPKPKKRKRNENLSLETDNVEIAESTLKIEKKKRKKIFENDLLKVDLSAIHKDDDSINISNTEKKSQKRKKNISIKLEPAIIPPNEESNKKRKRNSLEVEVDFLNTEETFDNSLKKKSKKSKIKDSINSTSEDNISRKSKNKDKLKTKQSEFIDKERDVKECTDKYEDLLKRLSLQIGDKSLIEELNNVLTEGRKKNKK